MARAIQRMLAMTAALLFIGGCGGGDGSATAETPTATTSAIANVPLSIDEKPRRGVKARAVGTRLVVRTNITGHAQPFSVLRVVSVCGKHTCTTGATADGDGRWRTSVLLSASMRKPYARVTAELSGESAVTLIRLRAPRSATKAGDGRDGRDGDRTARAGGAAAPEREAETPATGSNADAGSGDTPSSSAVGGAAPGAIPSPVRGTPELVLIGDSLAEGIAAQLPGQLPGWRVTTDGETGRTLRVGMQRWALSQAASEPTVSAFSLFTNDDPRNVSSLEAAVRQTAEAHSAAGCVVWATIARPPVNGVSYAAANAALQRVAAAYPGRVAIVPWAQAVAAHPEWLRSDGVHATPEGYAARARMYAEAARGCTGL
ncbi:MAG TPA: hypothetical protein VFR97_12745 [Capillimicrobium sp.]|nr:hypothetical protein [Capillimicrobium sp.]